MHDVHLRFDFVLPALPENALTQLRAPDTLTDPYEALKAELIRQISPNIHEQLNKLVYALELGGQARTQLMRSLLACLPAGEPAGLLFKHLFLLKLPGDLCDQVAKKMERLDALEQADYADTRWHVPNSKKAPNKIVVAVEPADSPNSVNGGSGELLTDTVAAVPDGKPSNKRGKPCGNKHVVAGLGTAFFSVRYVPFFSVL